MVGWRELLGWRRGPLDTAAEECRSRLAGLGEIAAELAGAHRLAQKNGDPLEGELDRRLRETELLASRCTELLMATSRAADMVGQVATAVHECRSLAARTGHRISARGAIRPAPDAPLVRRLLPGGLRPGSRTLSRMVRETGRLAESAWRDYAARLHAVREGSSAGAPAERPDPAWSPSERAAWWRALPPAAAEGLLKRQPELLGGLDGIDSLSRDRANRLLLAERLCRSRTGLGELLAVERVLEAWDRRRGPGHARLLVFEQRGGRLRVAVGLGDLERVDCLSVYVPGMYTTAERDLRDSLRDLDRIAALAAERHGLDRARLGLVSWIGYDVPLSVLHVLDAQRARTGGAVLSDFLWGLRAAHAGRPRVCVFGHSYGSTTTGMMAGRVPVGLVDDIVLFGSPGSAVRDVAEYNITGRPYVSAISSHDAVQGLGPDVWYGADPARMPGFVRLSGRGPRYTGPAWNPLGRHSSYLLFEADGAPTGIVEDFAAVMAGAGHRLRGRCDARDAEVPPGSSGPALAG